MKQSQLLNEISKEYRREIFLSLFFNITGTVLLCIGTIYIKRIIDLIPVAKTYREIIPLLLFFLVISSVKHLLFYLDEYPSRVLERGLYNKARIIATEKISKCNYLSYLNYGTGKIYQQIDRGANAARDIILFYLRIFTQTLPSIIINLLFIAYFDKTLFIVLLVVSITIFLLSKYLLVFLKRSQEKILNSEEEFSSTSLRAYLEVVTFRIGNYYKKQISKLNRLNKKIINSSVKKGLIHELFFFLFALFTLFIEGGIIFRETIKVVNGGSSIGNLYAMREFGSRILGPVAIFNVVFVSYKLNKEVLKRFLSLMNMDECLNLNNGKILDKISNKIEVKNLGFNYGNKKVFQNANFSIKKGEVLGIAGRSGSGKSTLLKTLLGLIVPEKGEVFIEENSLSGICLESYYNHISYISQEVPVFNGSLRENLIMGNNALDYELINVLEKVSIDIDDFPDGLETNLGERGVRLSGGERQRIALARTILNKSSMIILDEPFTGLDKKVRNFVLEEVLKFKNNSFVLIISHNTEVMEMCDRVLILEDGLVKES